MRIHVFGFRCEAAICCSVTCLSFCWCCVLMFFLSLRSPRMFSLTVATSWWEKCGSGTSMMPETFKSRPLNFVFKSLLPVFQLKKKKKKSIDWQCNVFTEVIHTAILIFCINMHWWIQIVRWRVLQQVLQYCWFVVPCGSFFRNSYFGHCHIIFCLFVVSIQAMYTTLPFDVLKSWDFHVLPQQLFPS